MASAHGLGRWLHQRTLGRSATLLAGVVIGLVAYQGFAAWRYVRHAEAPSVVSQSRPLEGFSADAARVLEGTPNFRAAETSRSPDGRVITGLWACDGPTRFEWHFALDETVHLLEGQVDVEYQGQRFTLKPGDVATFHALTRAVWHVPVPSKKAFTLRHPGRLVLWWRALWRQAPAAAGAASPP